jgi:chromosome segregation ATPase
MGDFMKFQKMTLFALLLLPVCIKAPDAENVESIAPAEHTKELTVQEKEDFEKHLKQKAQTHYKNGDMTGLRAWNYKNKAHELTDNDIKRHLMDSSDSEKLSNNLKQLTKEQLKDLQTRLKKRIKENEAARFSSKGLRDDLMTLSKTVGDHISEKYIEEGQPATLEYYKKSFTKNIQEFSDIQDKINKKQKEIEKLQQTIASRQQDLANAKANAQKARNENNPNLAKTIETRMQASEQEINKLKSQITSLAEDIQDSKNRTNLNQEDVGTALLEILKPTISPETIKKLNPLVRTIEATEFIDINDYKDAADAEKVNDPKINSIKRAIEELSKITPQIPEITKYINFLQRSVENHFLNLQNEAFKQYNDAQSKYLESKSEISKLEYKIQQAKRISNVFGKESDIEKSKNYLRSIDQDISEYEDELEGLQKNPVSNKERIAAVKRLIINAKREKRTELEDLGLNQKDIESYEALSTEEMKLKKFQEEFSKSTGLSTSSLKLQKYFETQAKTKLA